MSAEEDREPRSQSAIPIAVAEYFAFISYSHRDKAWAQWLHRTLEAYRVPRRLVGQRTSVGLIPSRLLPIFRDRDELASAADLGSKVNEALAHSANLIVICSPHAAASQWVDAEVLAFRRLGHAERVFCLIVDGEPNASAMGGREAEECFVPALRHVVSTDGELTQAVAEPIAADARPGKDSRANAKLKLIAGMLGVGFDSLKQRELHRRNRRLAAVAGLAAVALVGTTILAISAVIARHDAERRQKQAENLVDFMLGDLSDKLGEVHRLDIMQAVDDKAMAYFSSMSTKDVTDAALAQRVTALDKIGGVRMDRGQMGLAVDSYRAASTLAGDLMRRAPDDLLRRAAYADSLKWIGQAYWFQGDLGSALEYFQQASTLLDGLVATSPANAEFADKLGYARNNVGHVLEARGEFAAAGREYDAVQVIYLALVKRHPESGHFQGFLGDAYNNVGKLALEQGHLDRAVVNYRADQRIKTALAARDPGNHDAQENLLRSTAILGRTLALCGEMEAAVHYVGQSVDAARQLVAFDPKDAGWQEYLGLYSYQLGGLLRQQRRTDSAETADAEAVRVLAALLVQNPADSDLQQELAQSRLESARLKLLQGQTAAALDFAVTADRTIGELRNKSPTDRRLILLAAEADIALGEVVAKRQDADSAREYWAHAAATLAPALHAGDDPIFLAASARALLLRDEVEAARPLVAKLEAIGYRTPDFDALLAAKNFDYTANAEVLRSIAATMQ